MGWSIVFDVARRGVDVARRGGIKEELRAVEYFGPSQDRVSGHFEISSVQALGKRYQGKGDRLGNRFIGYQIWGVRTSCWEYLVGSRLSKPTETWLFCLQNKLLYRGYWGMS